LLVRDLVPVDQFELLYGSWESVMGHLDTLEES
jgi:hypothetical protein